MFADIEELELKKSPKDAKKVKFYKIKTGIKIFFGLVVSLDLSEKLHKK